LKASNIRRVSPEVVKSAAEFHRGTKTLARRCGAPRRVFIGLHLLQATVSFDGLIHGLKLSFLARQYCIYSGR